MTMLEPWWGCAHPATAGELLQAIRMFTWRHPPSFHVAGVALGGIYFGFAWQAWHLWHWAGSGGVLGRAWSPVTARHFAWQVSSLCVAGVALGDIHLHLACSRGTLLGRCGTTQHSLSFCVAGVALGDIHLLFAWQVWHLETSNGMPFAWQAWFCVAGVAHTQRCHTPSFTASFCVAGVALGDIHLRFTWQAWHLEASTLVLRGRRGTCRHLPFYLGFAW